MNTYIRGEAPSENVGAQSVEEAEATTSLADAEAGLIEALAAFEAIGIIPGPSAYTDRRYKPLSKNQRKAVASAAAVVQDAVRAVERSALNKVTSMSGANWTNLHSHFINANIISVLMVDVCRVVAQTDNPKPIAHLIFLAQYLGGLWPRYGRPTSTEGKGEDDLADLIARGPTARAA
jgi:hypothetical protein